MPFALKHTPGSCEDRISLCQTLGRFRRCEGTEFGQGPTPVNVGLLAPILCKRSQVSEIVPQMGRAAFLESAIRSHEVELVDCVVNFLGDEVRPMELVVNLIPQFSRRCSRHFAPA